MTEKLWQPFSILCPNCRGLLSLVNGYCRKSDNPFFHCKNCRNDFVIDKDNLKVTELGNYLKHEKHNDTITLYVKIKDAELYEWAMMNSRSDLSEMITLALREYRDKKREDGNRDFAKESNAFVHKKIIERLDEFNQRLALLERLIENVKATLGMVD